MQVAPNPQPVIHRCREKLGLSKHCRKIDAARDIEIRGVAAGRLDGKFQSQRLNQRIGLISGGKHDTRHFHAGVFEVYSYYLPLLHTQACYFA
jgi:hypothetical protein